MLAALRSGSRPVNAPQNTPTTEQPLSSGRFRGILRDVAGGESDDQESSVPGHRAQSGLAEIATDGVVADVDASVAGDLLHPGPEVLGGVVDGLRRRRTGDTAPASRRSRPRR